MDIIEVGRRRVGGRFKIWNYFSSIYFVILVLRVR